MAELLHVDVSTVRGWYLKGLLEGAKSGPGKTCVLLFSVDVVKRLQANGKPIDRRRLSKAERAARPAPAVVLPRSAVKTPEPRPETTTEPIDGPSFTMDGLRERWGATKTEIIDLMRAAGVKPNVTGSKLRFAVPDVRRVEASDAFRRRAAGM